MTVIFFYAITNCKGHEQLFRSYYTLVNIAWFYYVKNYTQSQIAQKLFISRAKVQRALTLAKKEGIVKFNISQQNCNLLSLEEKFKHTFGLDDVIIIP